MNPNTYLTPDEREYIISAITADNRPLTPMSVNRPELISALGYAECSFCDRLAPYEEVVRDTVNGEDFVMCGKCVRANHER